MVNKIKSLLFYVSYHLTFCTKITTVKTSTWCHTFLTDHRENLKVHFFQGDLASPYMPLVKGKYVEVMSPKSPDTNILELLLTGLTSPISKQSAQQSRLCLLFAAIYQIYRKRINPKFARESECNHINVAFSMPMLLSDIWSRSNFWVNLHPSWVLMSVKQLIHSPIYRLNQSLLQMLASFLDLFEWFWWYLWPKMALEMSQEFPTVSLDITNKACH